MGKTCHGRANSRKTENRRDRLSSLPDHLLVSIISLLPFKSAIVTDVLSKRWRGLWTHCAFIDLYIYKRPNEFFNYIGNLLPKLTSPLINRFSLVFNTRGQSKTFTTEKRRNYSHIPSWFDWVFVRGDKQVREFKFNIHDETSNLVGKYPDTPLCVFQLSSLVVLKLRPWLFLHSEYDDDNSSFNLPNLKRVTVQLHSLNTRVLEKLVSNSPSLEDLDFELCLVKDKYLSLKLGSASVKRLDMELNYPIEIVMNTPSLEYLGLDLIYDYRLHYQISFLSAPTTLRHCSILLDCSKWPHSYTLPDLIQPSAFYSAISNVVSLTITDEKPGPLLAATTFRHLTHLTLVVWNNENALFSGLALLHQFPVLEVLTVDMTVCHRIKKSTWSLPDSAPHCLVTCVKRIEILVPSSRRLAGESLLHLLKYLLGSATTLKLLKINIDPPCQDSGEFVLSKYDEPQLIKEVFQVPRSSPQCRIVFNGLDGRVFSGGRIR